MFPPFPVVNGRVISDMYSGASDGNRSWRFRVVQVSVVIRGSSFTVVGTSGRGIGGSPRNININRP